MADPDYAETSVPSRGSSVSGNASGASPGEDRPWRIVLAVLVLSLSLGGFILLAGSAVARHAVALAEQGQPLSPWTLLSAVGMASLVPALVALVSLTWLVVAERRDTALSRFLRVAGAGPMAAVATILCAFLGLSFFFPGLLLTADSASHVTRFHEIAMALRQGELPQWTNYQYLGSPLLAFTGPLTYVAGGALTAVLGDATVSAKLWLWGCHLATGLVAYALFLRLGLSRAAALAGMLAWTCSFAYLQLFLHRGLMPQAATVLFLAILFLSAEGLMTRRVPSAWDWLLFALATAGMIVNHQPHAPFAALYLGLFGAVRLLRGEWRLAAAFWPVTAGIVGVLIAAIAILPVLEGADWVMMDPGAGLFRLRIPRAEQFLRLFIWRNTRSNWGSEYWAYVGTVPVILAVIGTWAGLAGRIGDRARTLVLATLPCLALSVFLANQVVRDIMFLDLFVAILAAAGIQAIATWTSAGGRWVTFAFAALLLDLFSTAIIPTPRPGKDAQVAAGRYLEQAGPNERVVELTIERDGKPRALTGPEGSPANAGAMFQRISGHHNMAATLVHNYILTIADRAERDLWHQGVLDDRTRTLLGVLNVSRIVCWNSHTNGCPARFAGTVDEPPLGAVVSVAATPVLFSRRLVQLSAPADLDKPALWDPELDADPPLPRVQDMLKVIDAYVDAAQPDIATRTAVALPVREPVAESQPADGPWTPILKSYAVSLTSVRVEVQADKPGYVQLSHPWYPGMRVTLNGVEVTPLRGMLNLMVVPIPAGDSVIVVAPRTTAATRLAGMVSLVGLVLACAGTVIVGLRGVRRAGS